MSLIDTILIALTTSFIWDVCLTIVDVFPWSIGTPIAIVIATIIVVIMWCAENNTTPPTAGA